MAKVHEKHQVELPFVTSTPSTSFIVQGNLNQHTRNQENSDTGGTGQKSANYKYRLQDIPTFNGQPSEFPQWMNEWLTVVQPGHDDVWIMRNLQDRTLKEDDIMMFQKPDEAWNYLKSKYANPVKVSATQMDGFMKLRSMPGANDQQKLIKLESTLLKLVAQLRAVDQVEQITNNLQTFP